MGSGSDVELAKLLADAGEKDERRAEAAAVDALSEWRWSSTGWGMQPRRNEPSPDAPKPPVSGKNTNE